MKRKHIPIRQRPECLHHPAKREQPTELESKIKSILSSYFSVWERDHRLSPDFNAMTQAICKLIRNHGK